MKINLESLFSTLGLNIGLIAVFAALLHYFGIDLNYLLTIVGSMVGLQLIISLVINVLKWGGAISDGVAGKWSAALNLCGVAVIAVVIYINPVFDFTKLDSQLVDIARFGALLFGFVVQFAGTKYVHQMVTYGLGVKQFSNTLSYRSA